jgi:hypothetical protein
VLLDQEQAGHPTKICMTSQRVPKLKRSNLFYAHRIGQSRLSPSRYTIPPSRLVHACIKAPL